MARDLNLNLCNAGRITDHGVQAVVRRISSLKILEVPTVFLYSTRAACRRLRAGHIGLAHRHAAAAPALAVLLVPFLSSATQFCSAAAPATPPLAQPPRRRRRVRVPRHGRTSERAVRLRSLLGAASPPRPRVSSAPCASARRARAGLGAIAALRAPLPRRAPRGRGIWNAAFSRLRNGAFSKPRNPRIPRGLSPVERGHRPRRRRAQATGSRRRRSLIASVLPPQAARRRRDRSASRRCSNVVHNYIQLYCIIQLHYISCYITNYTTANAQAEASGVSERVASLLETGKFKMLLLDGFVRDDP